jgi:hypothetical protein
MLKPCKSKFAGFFIGGKTPLYAPNRNKKVYNSGVVRWQKATHQNAHNYLIVNMFSE